MSCYHRYWHGCDWPPPPDWYDQEAYRYRPRRYPDELVVVRDDDDDPEEERPRRGRRTGRGRSHRAEWSADEEVTAGSLQARAEALREELERIEQDLRRLSAGPASGTTET